MMRLTAVLLSFILFGAGSAAEKPPNAEVEINRLLEMYDAGNGNIDNLFTLYTDLDSALRKTLIGNLNPDALPGYGSGEQLVYEFSDYQCSYCRFMYPILRQAAAAGKIRVILIELPILGEISTTAAKHALAAYAQGKFLPFHDYLMQQDGRLGEHAIAEAVDIAALDEALLHDYLGNDDNNRQLERNYKLAALIGVNATPSFIIHGEIYYGALSEKDLNDLLEQP